ncbi:hypothetical protein C8J57DRAFT_1521270 [Mycena rebaudengoi]|nr:hypothetical protein C8J57DRAFT_1521270 [Mycena rebaudengoi]
MSLFAAYLAFMASSGAVTHITVRRVFWPSKVAQDVSFPASVVEVPSLVGPQFYNATWIHQLPQLFYENECELYNTCDTPVLAFDASTHHADTVSSRFVGHALSVFAVFVLTVLAVLLLRLPRARATRRIQRFHLHVARSSKFTPRLLAIEEEELGEFLELPSIQSSFTGARLLQSLKEAVDSAIPPSPPLLHPAADVADPDAASASAVVVESTPTPVPMPPSLPPFVAELPTATIHEAAADIEDDAPSVQDDALAETVPVPVTPPCIAVKSLNTRPSRVRCRTAPEDGQLDLPAVTPGSAVPRITPLSPSVATAPRRPSILVPVPALPVLAEAPVQVPRLHQVPTHANATIIYQTQRPSGPPKSNILYETPSPLNTRLPAFYQPLPMDEQRHQRVPLNIIFRGRPALSPHWTPALQQRPAAPYPLQHQDWNPYPFAAQARPLAVQ